ncbi:DUF397 domain-containing protein [Streptomyces sp. ET3-23]|uniref:DUF397 domain-containing protein n=1 Tax=Streptomyces sp. ET3-23 TaxID=2885643 RepID=UPI001D0FBAF6|nr:DUF397 domain-containing protein [Streptomyces sp. ET3-23]MCC2280576.1 DUF397 domain-containing protein [Streptomyces sp. ET3-23]
MSTITLDLTIATWRKSTYSENNGGCIEIAEQYSGVMPVRDSKDPNRAPIVVPRAAWSQFVNAAAADSLSA